MSKKLRNKLIKMKDYEILKSMNEEEKKFSDNFESFEEFMEEFEAK